MACCHGITVSTLGAGTDLLPPFAAFLREYTVLLLLLSKQWNTYKRLAREDDYKREIRQWINSPNIFTISLLYTKDPVFLFWQATAKHGSRATRHITRLLLYVCAAVRLNVRCALTV